MNRVAVMRVCSLLLSGLAISWAMFSPQLDAQSTLRFTSGHSSRVEVGQSLTLSWRTTLPGAQARYRLILPSAGLYGLRSLRQSWSDWSPHADGAITYSGFVDEGTYRFQVEARAVDGRTERVDTSVEVHFVMPEILEQAMEVNWIYVDAAPSPAEWYRRLAQELDARGDAWEQLYRAEYARLRATSSPDEISRMFLLPLGQKFVLAPAITNAASPLIRAQFLAVKGLYDRVMVYSILKQVGISGVMVVRNAATNRAMFSMLAARVGAEAARRAAGNAGTGVAGPGQPLGDTARSISGGVSRFGEVVVIGRPSGPGDFQLSTNSYTREQAENNSELRIKTDRPMRGITIRFFLRNGWYKPMGFTVRDAATGHEYFRVENSQEKYEEQVFVEVHGARELVIAPTSTRGDYAMIYASSSIHWSPR